MNVPAPRRPPHLFAGLLISLGIAFAAGGVRLLALGGSAYYAVAGTVLVVSGALVWRGHRRGALAYGLLLIGTLLWSLYEVGVDLRALAPRLLALSAIGLWFLTPWVRRPLYAPATPPSLFRTREGVSLTASVLVISVTVLALGGFRSPVSASTTSPAPMSAAVGASRSTTECVEAHLSGLTPLDQLWRRIQFRATAAPAAAHGSAGGVQCARPLRNAIVSQVKNAS